MCGGGSGATLEALPIPLGSIVTLFNPPAFAGPDGIPLIAKFPVPAAPAFRANEELVEVKTIKSAKTTFTEVFDMGMLHCNSLKCRCVKLMWVRNPPTPLNCILESFVWGTLSS